MSLLQVYLTIPAAALDLKPEAEELGVPLLHSWASRFFVVNSFAQMANSSLIARCQF